MAPPEVSEILQRMYKQSPRGLIASFSVLPPEDVPALEGVELLERGLVLGVSRECSQIDLSRVLVVGGPCIDHCQGDPEQVVTQLAIDIINPLMVANRLRRPCLIYLATLEEALTREVRSESADRRWESVTEALERFVHRLAGVFAVDVLALRTGDPMTQEITGKYVQEYRDLLSVERLRGLYSIGSAHPRAEASPERYESYRYTVAAYLPRVLREATRLDFRDVLVAENLQEARAVTAARWLNDYAESATRDRPAIGHMIFVPSPSLSGTTRMYRAPRRSAIYLLESELSYGEKLRRAAVSSQYYWTRIWPRELTTLTSGGTPLDQAISSLVATRELFRASIPAQDQDTP